MPGLVGFLSTGGSVTASWSTAAVSSSGDGFSGGLVGQVGRSTGQTVSVVGSYATGPVTASGTGAAGGASTAFRVRAFVGSDDTRVDGVESDATTATQVIDYDRDDDGLIEISTLAQLQAGRLDTNGDGRTDERFMQPLYDRAFPGAAPAMGCPTRCRGYELTTDDLTPRP